MKKDILIVFALSIVGLLLLSGCQKEQVTASGELNGHSYVDLGLPSGTLWATCNIGASHAEDQGELYAWGETRTKANYYWDNYCYGDGWWSLTKYCPNPDYGYDGFADYRTRLLPSDDVATVKWGDGWRMPSYNEVRELFLECSWKDVRINGVKGFLFTGMNGNTLFIRGDIELWSNELDVSKPFYAYCWCYDAYCRERPEGCYVRPVTSGR